MPAAAIPECELRRVAALRSFHILDTATDENYNRFTRLAAGILDTPIAAISLVDSDRQWFKSVVGLDINETSRDVAICAHTILSDEPLIICDAKNDPRFSDNALVNGDPNIRFYAGAPLTTVDGYRIGSLCAIDTHVRTITGKQRDHLVDLSNAVMAMFEMTRAANQMQRFALTDALTSLPNRAQFFSQLMKTVEEGDRAGAIFSLLYIDCDNFKQINDEYGHHAGDAVLCHLATILQDDIRGADLPARLGGDEFAVILPHSDAVAARAVAERVQTRFGLRMKHNNWAVSLSVGITTFLTAPTSAQEALSCVDDAMYEAKKRGKNQIVASVIKQEPLEQLGRIDSAWI